MSQVDELLLLLALYQKKYGILADSAVELIKKYLAEGYSPEKAIQMALKGSNFFAVNEGYIVDTAVTAAVLGYGLTDKAKVSTMRLRSAMLNEVWASDKLNLSKRLHGSRKDMRQTIVDAISSAMKQGKTWVQMARDLYDGYSYGHITKKTVLPEYLANLVRQSKKILTGDSSALGEYKTAIKNAERQIGRLANDGTPTKAMKQAFKDLVDATVSLNEDAIDKAIKVAVEEKSRYIADRIARTEMSQAWGDGFFAKYQDDPDVIAYRWRLSSRHPVYDICDIHASVDCYGLGEGIYPKDKFPKRPAHPHCMCLVMPVYVGNLEMDRQKENNLLSHAKFNPDAVSKYISGLSRQQQVSLLGVDGLKQFGKDGTWKNSLRLWQGHDKPSTRLKGEDFRHENGKGIITSSNSFIPKAKLVDYALNKNHSGDGRDKAVAFELALGYNQDNYKDLEKQVYAKLDDCNAVYKRTDKYGDRYQVTMSITGPNGKTAKVLTGWLLKDGKARLTTIYVDK